jgi:hypothetical protein
MSAVNLLSSFDVSDGVSQGEINLVYDLMNSNLISAEEVSQATGIPASEIQGVYDSIKATESSTPLNYLSSGNIFSGTGLPPRPSSVDTTPIGGSDLGAGERGFDPRGDIFAPPGSGSYISDFDRDLDIQDERERLADLQVAADYLKELGEAELARQAKFNADRLAAEQAAALAEEAAARQAEADEAAAQAAANSPEAAETQRKDDDFDAKVNAAGGVTPGTIGEVIEIALEVYGDDSRGVVKVISESLKGGLTMKDLEEATDLSGEEIMAAAKTAANDPNKSLTPGEILSGAANTVYDITNKVVDIVETGLEVTGIEKVIDTIGNTVSKIVGLDPNQTQKVLVVNPVTGQVTVQASNQPQGGILGSLPQSPYVPIGTTSGGTTYGIDAENAIINVVLGKILTNGGLDQGDTKSVIGAAVEETLGIPMEVAVGVINSAEDLVKGAVKTVTNSGVLSGSGNRQDDEEAAAETTGFEVITGGEGNDTITGGTGNDTITGGTGNDTSTSATDGLMGPFQVDDDGNIILPSSSTSNTTLTLAPTVTANTPCPTPGDVRDPNTLVCSTPVVGPGPCPNEGDIRDKNGDCYTPGPGGRTKIDEDLTVAAVTANTPCETTGEVRDPVTLVCAKPTGTTTGTTTGTITASTPCETTGEVRDPVTLVCGKPTGGQTKVCPKGTKLADQTVDINTDCGTIGGQTKVCPKGTKLADQTVDINTDCGTINTVVDEDDDKTVVVDGVTNVVNYICKEEGAVYNPVTERCEKTTNTTIDTTTNLTNVSCAEPGAVYDATMNNGQGGCYIDNSRVIEGAETRGEVSCSAEGAVYDATMNDGQGGCYIDNSRVITETIDRTNLTTNYVCEEGTWDETLQKCVNTVTGNVINKTICKDGSQPDANGNCITKVTGNTLTQTVCETGTWDETLQKCVNTVNGNVINKTICKDGSDPDANGNCLVTITLDTTTNTICPEGSYKGDDNRCYNDVTGEVVQNNVCPAGTTYNETSKQCEYSKYFCGPGFTFNILTSKCEPDEEKEKETGGITTLPIPDLKVPGRGDFVTADDVLVENTGDVGGIYSILPAPVREPFLAGRRQQDIRNVADTVGIQQGAELEQDQAAVDRFAGYANAFDVGAPELLDISGVLPGDLPAYEEKFNVQFPEFGIAPPVRPDEDLFPIAGARFDPTTYTPTAMAAGGVVEKENGIESLMDRRQQAVNRMLIKRAGSYFGR